MIYQLKELTNCGKCVIIKYMGKCGEQTKMTNLEVVLIYFVIGLVFTLVIGKVKRCIFEPEEVLFGATCWVVIIMVILVRKCIKKLRNGVIQHR